MVRRTTHAYNTTIVASCPKCRVRLKLFRSSIPKLIAVDLRAIPFGVRGAQAPWRASLTLATMNYWSRY